MYVEVYCLVVLICVVFGVGVFVVCFVWVFNIFVKYRLFWLIGVKLFLVLGNFIIMVSIDVLLFL